MKRKGMSLIAMFVLGTVAVFAQSKTETFKVYGNCGMCESRIEKAANAVEGVTSADWDKETKMIVVSLDESKTDVHKVHMAIAKAGHDTEMHKAKDEDYKKLPGCCQYERPAKKAEMKKEMKKMDSHAGHQH